MSSGTFGCVLNGRAVRVPDAVVPATDEGLLRGDGVFEVVRLYSGVPFCIDDHLKRLGVSAATLHMLCDIERVREDVILALDIAAGEDALLRIVLTRGGQRLLLLERLPPIRPTLRLAVETHMPSPLLAPAKTLSYAANMHGARLARERGFDDALLIAPDDTVLEATRSAVFWVEDGRLFAPPLDVGILDSITRRRIFEMEPCRERRITLDQLADAEEVLVADSVVEALPVVEVEGIGTFGASGPVTARVKHGLHVRIRQERGVGA
jgi:branched-chain amino acid aminotransferase